MNDQRTDWVNNLRSTITVLVVAHHSALAYTSYAHFDDQNYIRSTHAVVDSVRWKGLDVFVNFNDIFFMSLMFMVGGMFLSRSIERKGTRMFIRDRWYRLFVPFFLGGTLLMLVAYFPSFYLTTGSINIISHIRDFLTLQRWPVGPPWFIWVLFLFNIVFALSYRHTNQIYNYLTQKVSTANRGMVVLALYVTSWILYVPLAFHVGPGTWTGWGPFDFQASRILLYFGYFLAGVIAGKGNFAFLNSKPDRIIGWKGWILCALAAFILLTLIVELNALDQMVKAGTLTEFTGWMIYFSVYVASCVCTTIAFIATFHARVNVTSKKWQNLNRNAYLIYLIHFVFVTWLQWLLLTIEINAFIKFIIVFILSLSISWTASAALRKINLINKYL